MPKYKLFLRFNVIALITYFVYWYFSGIIKLPSFHDYAQLFISVTLTLEVLYFSFFLKKETCFFKIPLVILSFAILANTLGDIFWQILHFTLPSIPYPSVPDLWYLLFYLFTFIGINSLFVYIHHYQEGVPEIFRILFMLIVLSIPVTLFISFKYLHATWAFHNMDLAFIFDILYMLFDVLLLIHTFLILYYVGHSPKVDFHLSTPIYLMEFSLIILFLADVVFSYVTEIGNYSVTGFVEVLYLTFLVLFANSIITAANLPKPKITTK